MAKRIVELQQENLELARLASHDELTGLLNRRALEKAVSDAMIPGNAMLVCDLDRFKNINDNFGHLAGDHCLQKAAELLQHAMRSSDIVGRIGGDEFVVFALGQQNEATIETLRRKIENQFFRYSQTAEIPLNITVGGAICTREDDYTSLFARADSELLRLKKEGHVDFTPDRGSATAWLRDFDQIRADLTEQLSLPGAYCRDYDYFKTIYRYIERGMMRSSSRACLVLISLADPDGILPNPQDVEHKMELLGKVIQRGIRMGDVYTRYTNCQYLLLLTNAQTDVAEIVINRLREEFKRQNPDDCLFFHYSSNLGAPEIGFMR